MAERSIASDCKSDGFPFAGSNPARRTRTEPNGFSDDDEWAARSAAHGVGVANAPYFAWSPVATDSVRSPRRRCASHRDFVT